MVSRSWGHGVGGQGVGTVGWGRGWRLDAQEYRARGLGRGNVL